MSRDPTRSIPPGALRMLPPWLRLVLVVIVAAVGWWYQGRGGPAPSGSRPAPTTTVHPPAPSEGAPTGEQAVLDAFRNQRSDLVVEVTGAVTRVLPDDAEGDRHQKFLVKLPGGQTLLVAHNIDVAPRVPVKEKDTVSLRGEYEWSEQGGTVHWTHKSSRGTHQDGWIKLGGKFYQ